MRGRKKSPNLNESQQAMGLDVEPPSVPSCDGNGASDLGQSTSSQMSGNTQIDLHATLRLITEQLAILTSGSAIPVNVHRETRSNQILSTPALNPDSSSSSSDSDESDNEEDVFLSTRSTPLPFVGTNQGTFPQIINQIQPLTFDGDNRKAMEWLRQ